MVVSREARLQSTPRAGETEEERLALYDLDEEAGLVQDVPGAPVQPHLQALCASLSALPSSIGILINSTTSAFASISP
jgi:hypothetical protein